MPIATGSIILLRVKSDRGLEGCGSAILDDGPKIMTEMK